MRTRLMRSPVHQASTSRITHNARHTCVRDCVLLLSLGQAEQFGCKVVNLSVIVPRAFAPFARAGRAPGRGAAVAAIDEVGFPAVRRDCEIESYLSVP